MMMLSQLKPHTPIARLLPVVVEILLQKERLKIMNIDISSKDFFKPDK
jgi:hypothetical protein